MGILIIGPRVQTDTWAQSPWSSPILISTQTKLPWFPDIAVDADGRIHVVYDTRDVPIGEDEVVPGIMYTAYGNGEWRVPNNIHLGKTGNIFRPAIAVDPRGNVHLTALGVRYWRAPGGDAWSAAAWHKHVLDSGTTYMSDIAIDSQGTVHAAYEKWILLPETIQTSDGRTVFGLSDIFYRRSSDGGQTWTVPFNLSQTAEIGSHRVQIKVDGNDIIHVTWDEGWDRWSLYDTPREGVYVRSADGGRTWSKPVRFVEPERTNAQMAAVSDNQGNVLAIWRPTTIDQIYYTWSTDGGASWAGIQPIPNFYARAYNDTMFDAYDMATDSVGKIHLVAVGRTRPQTHEVDAVPLGIYHLTWNGMAWSDPEPIAIYEPEVGFPEYPKLAISEGNQLHVVWFVRDEQFGGKQYRILYSHSESSAPRQKPPPTPTALPTTTPTPTLTPTPMATPLPTVDPTTSGMPSGLYTENDDVGQLFIALSPVALVAFLLMAIKLGWWRRLFSR
jgi:hypothetical protein